MPLKLNMNDRERQRNAANARKAAALFMNIADDIESKDDISLALNLIQVSLVGGQIINELSKILQDAAHE